MKSVGLTILKVAIAALLAWYVVSHVEVRDRVAEPKDPNSEIEIVYDGELEGDWRSEDWSFTATDGRTWTAATLPEGWKLEPGFFSLLAGIRIGWFGLSVLCWSVVLIVVTFRWQILLRAAGVPTGYFRAMRLCFIGYFFNNVMLGLTGGDLVRAVMVTRGLEQNRAAAAMSVIVDRVLGLAGMLLLGAGALFLADFDGPASPGKLTRVKIGVVVVLLVIFLGGWAYISRRARAVTRLDSLLAKLPAADKVAKIDGAITLYRGHKGAVLQALGLSVFLQAFAILSFWSMGESLGGGLALVDNFVVYPVVQTVSSVPIAPAGWGVGETLFGRFFQGLGSTFTLGVSVSILFRLMTQIGVGLVGGLVWTTTKSADRAVLRQETQES